MKLLIIVIPFLTSSDRRAHATAGSKESRIYRADQKNLSTSFNWCWRRKTYKMAVAHIIKMCARLLPYFELDLTALHHQIAPKKLLE